MTVSSAQSQSVGRMMEEVREQRTGTAEEAAEKQGGANTTTKAEIRHQNPVQTAQVNGRGGRIDMVG